MNAGWYTFVGHGHRGVRLIIRSISALLVHSFARWFTWWWCIWCLTCGQLVWVERCQVKFNYTTSSNHLTTATITEIQVVSALSLTLYPTLYVLSFFVLSTNNWFSFDLLQPYVIPYFAIHKFLPRFSIVCFLAYWCIHAAIGQYHAHTTSHIRNPGLFHWVIWYVIHYFLRFLDLDGSLSCNLHKSHTGSWKARHCCHWTVWTFQGGRSHFTLHVYPVVLSPEAYPNGGQYWASHTLFRNQYRKLWLVWVIHPSFV